MYRATNQVVSRLWMTSLIDSHGEFVYVGLLRPFSLVDIRDLMKDKMEEWNSDISPNHSTHIATVVHV